MCVYKELYGRFLHNLLKWDLESPLVEGSHVHVFVVLLVCVDLIIGGLKDHLGVPREGVWAVSLCLT